MLTLSERHRQQHPTMELAAELNKNGEISLQKGNLNEAWRLFYQSLEITYHLKEKTPSPDIQYDLAVTLIKFGDVSFQLGNFDVVRKVYDESLLLMRTLFKEESGAPDIKSDLSILLLKFAQVLSHLRDIRQAIRFCNESLELSLQSFTERKSVNGIRNLAEVYSAMARLALLNNDRKTALQASQQAKKCYHKLLSRSDVSDFLHIQDEANYYELSGATALLKDKSKSALTFYEKALAFRKNLLNLSETHFTLRNVSIAAANVGASAFCRKNMPLAIDAYFQSLENRKRLSGWLKCAIAYRELGITHFKLSILLSEVGYKDRSIQHHNEAAHNMMLYQRNSDDCEDVRNLSEIIK